MHEPNDQWRMLPSTEHYLYDRCHQGAFRSGADTVILNSTSLALAKLYHTLHVLELTTFHMHL